jgi:hypothetical protein
VLVDTARCFTVLFSLVLVGCHAIELRDGCQANSTAAPGPIPETWAKPRPRC